MSTTGKTGSLPRGEPDRSLLRAQWRSDDDGCLVRRSWQAPGGEVIVHVAADLLTGLRTQLEATGEDYTAPARCHLDNGPGLALETIEKMTSDGGIWLTTHASDGRTLDVGRRRRRPDGPSCTR